MIILFFFEQKIFEFFKNLIQSKTTTPNQTKSRKREILYE